MATELRSVTPRKLTAVLQKAGLMKGFNRHLYTVGWNSNKELCLSYHWRITESQYDLHNRISNALTAAGVVFRQTDSPCFWVVTGIR